MSDLTKRALGHALWKNIALAYETPRAYRTTEETDITQFGLCHAVCFKCPEIHSISAAVIAAMLDEIHYGGRKTDHFYFCALKPQNDQLRADFAWLQYYRLGGK